jgi:hypothetical protein
VSREVTTRILSEEEHGTWNDFVFRSPQGSPYANTEYLGILCSVAGGSYRVLVAEKGGECLGGCALYERRWRSGTAVEPRLLLQYNGFVLRAPGSRYPSVNTALDIKVLRALSEAIAGRGYARCVLKSRPALTDGRVFGGLGWRVVPTYTYEVNLADLDRQWGLMEQNLRRLVKRAEQHGLEFTDDTDFDSFFRLHREVHARKGAPLYLPEQSFRSYFERLLEESFCRLFHARLPGGRAIASQLVLVGTHPFSHTVSASAQGDQQHLGANPFLRWRAFEALAAAGSSGNDLTDASLNPVTRFKSQLGGELRTCLAVVTPWSRSARMVRTVERAARTVLRPMRKVVRR